MSSQSMTPAAAGSRPSPTGLGLDSPAGEAELPYYCYILRCADQRYYVGATHDLPSRLAAHQAGRVPATRLRRPVAVVYYEAFATAEAAYRRERSLKNGRTRKATRERLIRTFPPARLGPFSP